MSAATGNVITDYALMRQLERDSLLLRGHLIELARMVRLLGDALRLDHPPSCLCICCTTRRQATAMADHYEAIHASFDA